MERETKAFTTPGGHSFLLKSYLSGREAKQIEAVMYAAVKMDPENVMQLPDGRTKVKINEVSADFVVDQEKKLVELLLVTLDGEAENAIDRLLDLPAAEYEAVKAEVDKITNPTTPGNSEQPGQGTSEAAQ